MKTGSLFWRIYMLLLAGILAALISTTWHSARALQRFYEQLVSEELAARAMLAARYLSCSPFESQQEHVQALCDEMARITGSRVTVILPSGAVIGDSCEDPRLMEHHADRPEIAAALRGETGESVRFSVTLNRNFKYVAVPVSRNGDIVASVRLSMPLADIRWNLRDISSRIFTVAVVAALLLGFAASYLSRRLSRPVENMRRIAGQLADGNLKARAEISGADEIAVLARTLNKMAQQMEDRVRTITRQRNDLEAVLTCMVEGVVAVGRDERIIQINQAAARMIGMSAEHAVGRNIQEAARYYDLQQFISETLAARAPTESEIMLYGEEERCIQVHGAPLMNEQNINIGGLIVMNDVSRLKRLENARRDFIANISHEIGTPMTAIKGCAEALASDPPPDAGASARFMTMIARHIERLDALVKDILSLSRIEHDHEHKLTHFDTHSINDVLHNAVESFSGPAKNKRIDLKVDCRDNLVARINAGLLEQAIGNLLDNAIKFSGEGTTVSVTARMSDDQIEIEVSDQGIGIENKHLPRIFERFYRVEPSRSRKLGGTGLGLAIVRHVALSHGGSVAAASTPGEGSVFTIRLPLQNSPRR